MSQTSLKNKIYEESNDKLISQSTRQKEKVKFMRR